MSNWSTEKGQSEGARNRTRLKERKERQQMGLRSHKVLHLSSGFESKSPVFHLHELNLKTDSVGLN